MKRLLRIAGIVLGLSLAASAAAQYRALPGGFMRSVLPADGINAPAQVKPFMMRERLVSVAEFRGFVLAHPEWRRDRVPALLARAGYLEAWHGGEDAGALEAQAPVTQVSWHAAQAFCASEGARLPRWYEWEFAAAADATRSDARGDAAWLAKILHWYERPAAFPLPRIGREAPNYFGLYDMHGLVWEWVEDFNGLFVSADSRDRSEQKQLEYCGGAAVSLGDRSNYAVLMRIALLAAMEGEQSGPYLGFRCVRDIRPHEKD